MRLGLGALAMAGALGCRDGGASMVDSTRTDARRDTAASATDVASPGSGQSDAAAGGGSGGSSAPGTGGVGGTGSPGATAGASGSATGGTGVAGVGGAGMPGTGGMGGSAPPPVDAAPPKLDTAPAPPPVDAPTAPTGPLAMPAYSAKSIAVYDESNIVDFHIDFPPGEFDKLKAPPGPEDARWVNCSFRFETDSAPAAHCRRKGDAMDWIHEIKPQIIVRFNFIDKQGRFRGLRRINLESFDGAEAPVRDRLGMWIMREAGINAPRVNHARVFKDGQYYGLYMNIESLDKEFLEDHFGADGTGNLWESANELKTNEAANDNTQLWALDKLVNDEPLGGDHTSFFQRLDALMDIPQVLREMAAETAMLTDDNFSNGSSNFYYYDHPKRRFMVLPWDLDTILTQGPTNADPFAFWGSSPPNKLRLLINENPMWRSQYADVLVELRDQVLTRAVDKLDGICNQIRAAVREDPTRTATFQDFETDCANVRARIPARIAALKQLLGR